MISSLLPPATAGKPRTEAGSPSSSTIGPSIETSISPKSRPARSHSSRTSAISAPTSSGVDEIVW